MTHDTMNMWILGLNFFSNYYTVFDQEELKVGFAISRYAHPRVIDFHQNSPLYASEIVIAAAENTVVKEVNNENQVSETVLQHPSFNLTT